MYNQVCLYTKTLTFLNKLDKRISSLLPFPVTLLIDFLERKECLSVHLPQRAMLPQVFKAKQSTMIMKRTVLALAEQRLILPLQFLLPPSACMAQLPRREEQSPHPAHLCMQTCTVYTHVFEISLPSVSCSALPLCFGLVFCQ